MQGFKCEDMVGYHIRSTVLLSGQSLVYEYALKLFNVLKIAKQTTCVLKI